MKENKGLKIDVSQYAKFFEMDQQQQFNDLCLAVLHKYSFQQKGKIPQGTKFTARLHADHGAGFLDLIVDGNLVDRIGLVATRTVYAPDQPLLTIINEMAEKMFREDTDYGLKDAGKLDAIVNSCMGEYFGHVPYPSVVEKAAALWHKIADSQCFYNGNKRTALLTGLFMLSVNGFELVNVDGNELYEISRQIANKQMTQADVAEFIRQKMVVKLYKSFSAAEQLDTNFKIRFMIDKDRE